LTSSAPVPGTVSTIPLFGRAWTLVVYNQNGDQYALSTDAWDPEALRVSFEVIQSTYNSPYWYADISVWNLNDQTAQNILLNATWITLSAGYQTGPSKSSVIWDGPVIQRLFTRDNVVDQIMRFNCIAIGGKTGVGQFLQDSIINTVVGFNTSQNQLVANMIALSNPGGGGTPLTPAQMKAQIGQLAQQRMEAKQYPRGRTVFGMANKYFDQIAGDNFVNYWRSANGTHYISELIDPSAIPPADVIYSPPLGPNATAPPSSGNNSVTRSIIGVPKQSPFGAICTILLDPRMQVTSPPLIVQLINTLISQQALQPNVLPSKGSLSSDGIYVVGQVRHYGDTRGNDWHSELTLYSPQWVQNLLTGGGAAYAAGAAQ
jgi:hypothetical protein